MAKVVVEWAIANGLLLNAPRPATLRLMPALNIGREEVDQMAAILGRGLREVQ